MRNHVQVAVIGGGVVGASVLYHLTKAGWRDVLLIERAELTSGSTWHAAGGMHTVNGDPNVAKLQQYTIELYKEIEAISGVSCGVHITGGLMLAGTPERVDWLRMAVARGRYLGMDLQLVSAAEAKKLYPLLDEKHFLGAIYDPIEGHVDPYGVTHAYAKSAQLAGAEIVRQNRVIDTRQRADGTWDVITEKGTVHAEHVVNAGGLWAREVGRFVGLELPILAMEHQYFITEDLPELKGQKELLHVIDFEAEIYMRQERQGMLLGTYERAGVPWSPKTTPWDFGQDLLPNDLERIAPSVTVAFEHFPRLETAGIKKVVKIPVIGTGRLDADLGEKLIRDGAVDFVEPNWVVQHAATSNDTYYTNGSLWGMYGDATAPSNQYGSREVPNIACECRQGNMHVFTDMVWLESVDDQLLVTSLTNRLMPMIRYAIGDSGLLKEGSCPCGSPFPLMQMDMCRQNDLILGPEGRRIHPSFFNGLLYGLTQIEQYQFVQDVPGKIALNMVATAPLDNAIAINLHNRLRHDTGLELELAYVDTIARSVSGKHRFVISRI